MNLRILEEDVTADTLRAHGEVSIAFTAASRFRVDIIDGGLGGVRLVEESVDPPRLHDYDAIEGESPLSWPSRWDVSGWRLFSAFDGDRRVAGAVVGKHSEGVCFLRGRRDMAGLWDIRVDHDYRRKGVGRAVFQAAADWARAHGCRYLKIETQNVNVAACRFYAAMGARLSGLDRFAYAGQPDEIELDWLLDLTHPA